MRSLASRRHWSIPTWCRSTGRAIRTATCISRCGTSRAATSEQILRDGVLSRQRAIAICRQVASALDAAHAQGLVHRDVKPSNILIDASDRAYLADFGLSRLSSDPARVPGVGSSLGTIDYVAPEQIRGDPADGRADVYALGCVLYECLTGTAPFSDRPEVAVLYAHLEEEPPAPPGLEHVMAKALAKDAEDRYATCGDLVVAAAEALGVSHERPSRRRLLAFAAIALVIAVAVVAGVLARDEPANQGAAGPATQGSSDTAGRLIRVDTNKGTVLGTFPIGTEPTGVAVGAGGVWAASYPSNILWKVDTVSGAVSITVSPKGAVALAATKGAVYAVFDSFYGDDGMEQIRPEAHPPVAHVVLKNGHTVAKLGDPTQVATGPGGVWGIGGDTLYQVVPLPGYVDQAARLVRIPSIEDEEHARSQLSGLAVGKDTVWVIGDVGDQRLWRVDIPSAARPEGHGARVRPGGRRRRLRPCVGDRSDHEHAVRDRSRARRVVRAIPVGREPMGVTVGAGAVWVANAIDGTISKVDPRTGRTVTMAVGGSPIDVSVGDGSVWVAADASSATRAASGADRAAHAHRVFRATGATGGRYGSDPDRRHHRV